MVADIHRNLFMVEYLCIRLIQEIRMENYVYNTSVIQWHLLLNKPEVGLQTVSKELLEVEPDKLHQRMPIFIGSEEDVRMVEKFMAEAEVPVSS